jgi:D-arabinose 1-dehydrogenase-like Zn-dependent alcohol dehydrogenase
VKVLECGLCHTDIHAANGDWPIKPAPPFISGHEGVGIVTELAPDEVAVGDRIHKVAVGDRVAMPWLGYACGCCNYCVSGARACGQVRADFLRSAHTKPAIGVQSNLSWPCGQDSHP